MSYHFPTARVKLQKSGTDPAAALVYDYHHGGVDDTGLQFEGDVSYAMGAQGVEVILNLAMFNVPRQQRGEVPISNALVGVEVGYKDPGAPPLSSIFLGHMIYGTPKMDGGTSVWNIHASAKSVSTGTKEWEWVPPTNRDGNGSLVTIKTVLSELAAKAGARIELPNSFGDITIKARTFRGPLLHILSNLARKANLDRIARGESGVFLVTANPAVADSFVVIDSNDFVNAFTLKVDQSQGGVYDAGYEIGQDQKTATETPTAAEVEADSPDANTNTLADETKYVLYYKMEMAMRPDAFLGLVVETTDEETGTFVRFAITSIVHNFGRDWTTTVRGPVLDPKGRLVF